MNTGDPKDLSKRLGALNTNIMFATSDDGKYETPEHTAYVKNAFNNEKQQLLSSGREAFIYHPYIEKHFSAGILSPSTLKEMGDAARMLTYFNELDPSEAQNPVFPGFESTTDRPGEHKFQHLDTDTRNTGSLEAIWRFSRDINDAARDHYHSLKTDEYAYPALDQVTVPEGWNINEKDGRVSDGELNAKVDEARAKMADGVINPHQMAAIYRNGVLDDGSQFFSLSSRLGLGIPIIREAENQAIDTFGMAEGDFFKVDQDLTDEDFRSLGYNDQQIAAVKAGFDGTLATSSISSKIMDEINPMEMLAYAQRIEDILKEDLDIDNPETILPETLREITSNDLNKKDAQRISDELKNLSKSLDDPNYRACQERVSVEHHQKSGVELLAEEQSKHLPEIGTPPPNIVESKAASPQTTESVNKDIQNTPVAPAGPGL